MAIKKFPISTISGSLAAFSSVVTPDARTAALIMFSVAPTLGNSSSICVPVNPLAALAMM